MNTKPRHFRILTAVALMLFVANGAVFGQMIWSSYDTSGNLVTANVATGGDLTSATSVSFTIPAGTQLFFVTKNFTPFSVAGALARKPVTFKVSASAGLSVAQRTMGWGLYNSAGTSGFADDVGYFGLWNGAGPYVETYVHRTPTDGNNLFAGTNPGEGKTPGIALSDGIIYTNQIQLVMNAAQTAISLGTSSSTLAACGIAMNGPGLAARGYTNPYSPLLGGATAFDEFAFMFNNTTANPVTVTLSAISLGNSMTWDASGANPTVPTDGAGNWSSTNANWSGGVGGAFGTSDSVWSPGYSAVIGANNGAAGTITITDPSVTVSNLTFNAAGSGSYNITGSPLILSGTPSITVASGVTATNSSQLTGAAFTKEGGGTLSLNPSGNNTYSGLTVINNGRVNIAGSDTIVYIPGDLQVNAGGVFAYANAGSGGPILPSATLIVNGGTVDNYVNQKNFYINNVVLDNNGLLEDETGTSYLNPTNFDARSGSVFYSRYRGAINFVKSTAGTVYAIYRPNSSGSDGNIVTLDAGTLIFQKDLNAANRLKTGSPLTLGGGTLMFTNDASGIAPNTENPSAGGTFLNPGASVLVNANAGTSGGNISLGALNRSVGGTFDFSQSGLGTVTTATANNNGILGGWATYAGANWLVGTTFAAYSGYQTSADSTMWLSTDNVSLSGDPSANLMTTSINSLRLTGASTITLNDSGQTLTLASGGLLVTGSGANTITGGTLEGAGGQDLVVIQNSTGDLTISSTLADNGGATSLTKSGSGKLIIAGTDNMTGDNYLNGGTVEVSDLTQLAAGPVMMNNGALRYTGPDAASTRGIILNGGGGTIDVAGSATLTQTTAIVGFGGFNSPFTPGLNLGDWGGLTKTGSGTLVLAANNVYNGPTVVSNGVLSVNGTNSLTGMSGLTNYSGGGSFIVYGGTLGGTGMISGPVTVKNGGTISPGNSISTLTLTTNLTLESGSTSLFEEKNGSSGDLLQVDGNLTIQPNSTIAVSVLGAALNPTTNTLITYTGTKSGSFNPTVVVAGGSLNSSLTVDESTPGEINLVAIPQVVITSQPQDAIVSTNDLVTFTVGATGSATIGYQWYFSTNLVNPPVPIDGANGSSYSIASADGTNNGLYSVVVTNSFNSVTSRFAVLIVGNVAPQLNGPFDQTVIQGNTATFNATVIIANPAPTFQWQTNGVDVAGATGTSLTLNNVQYDALNNATVSIIASNTGGIATNTATLTVTVPPVITPQLTNITVNVGDNASFISGATGHPAPGLQWYKNGSIISGQTSGTLTINNAQGSDIATYTLVASNVAGSITNSAKLTVNSTTLASTTVAPANGATGICYDTPLYVTFNSPVSIVNSGKIRIYNVTNSATPVDTIDMSSNTVVISAGIGLTNNIQPHGLFSGDSQVINYFPVIIFGNTAAIYPHGGVMTSNQTYYVTMDNGVVADGSGAYFAGISDTNAWQFTTKPTGPANPTNLVVAAAGSGDFDTVQGAVDSIPSGNNNYTLVNIHDGVYTEIVNISGKNNITFQGQSRTGTVVGYPNNNNLTPTTAGRMAFKVNSSDIRIQNLTLTNGTPQGGSQAETLLIYNNGLRCVVDNCDIKSRQDTILINASTSQGYFYNCKVIGNFDYIWGVGVGYFDNCVFHTITNTLSSSYNLTAARTLTSGALSATTPWVNPNGTTYSAYGFSFVNCTVEADPGVSGITLAGSNGTAGGLVSWALCKIDTNAYVSPSITLSNTYIFWQYSNTDITGLYPISFTNVQTIGVTNNDPRLLAATNPIIWFSGWLPQIAPNTPPVFTAPPAGTNIVINVGANLSVTCTAVDSDIPAQTLTYALLPGAPSGAAVNSASGLFTWRPPVASAGTSNSVIVTVTDNGSPNLSTTNSFSVSVNPVAQPTASAASYANGQFSLTVNGDTGPDYIIQTSTNLIDWQSLVTNSSPAVPFMFTDTNAAAAPVQFYRVLLGP